MTLAGPIERSLVDSLQRGDDGTSLAMEPVLAQRLVTRLGQWGERFGQQHLQPVLLCGATLRPHLRRMLERYIPSLVLLSPQEIAPSVRIHSLGVVTLDEN
jgi:flagellar biosynthesis protein FlhA